MTNLHQSQKTFRTKQIDALDVSHLTSQDDESGPVLQRSGIQMDYDTSPVRTNDVGFIRSSSDVALNYGNEDSEFMQYQSSIFSFLRVRNIIGI